MASDRTLARTTRTTRGKRPPVVLTMGDPAGIGPDITLAAWLARAGLKLPPFAVIGDSSLYRDRAKAMNLHVPVTTVGGPGDAGAVFAEAMPVLPVSLASKPQAGMADAVNAPAVLQSIEQGVDYVMAGSAAALVTNPINKAVLYGAGFEYPGHTEYLAALAARHGHPAHPVMMLVSDDLRVVPATIHLPLRQVPDALSAELIVRTVTAVCEALRTMFAVARPRIAVTGLNPHAGEDGRMGGEEQDVIAPALEQLRASGIGAEGPFPADTLFHAGRRKDFDAVVAMYHDQALVPVKTLAFDRAVNLTLGLPFVRTSPDHGTAYRLAGTGKANPASLIEAIRLADRLGVKSKTNT